jgi:hypothetical protein
MVLLAASRARPYVFKIGNVKPFTWLMLSRSLAHDFWRGDISETHSTNSLLPFCCAH